MKQVFVLAITAMSSLLFSCNNPATTKTSDAMPDSSSLTSPNTGKQPSPTEVNADHMRTVYKGIETGDLSAMDGFCDKDMVDHDERRGDMKGLDSIKKVLADIHNHISDLKIELISSATDGDYCFTLSRMTGKTKDASMGVPANTPVDNESVDVVKVVNGKATDHWDYEKPRAMASSMHDKNHKGKM